MKTLPPWFTKLDKELLSPLLVPVILLALLYWLAS
jgi:hypothetical protein